MHIHPLQTRARVLLTSVFAPYAQDDEYGSRLVNPMELYHNQVTRTQGPFSVRMFTRSWGLMFIQANISAPCTLLDFPSVDRFVEELRKGEYDIVGISSILPNIGKVKVMCDYIRKHLPEAVIVVGGHIANYRDLESVVDADHVVTGEGIRWFRRFLGEDEHRPIRHPLIVNGFGRRVMGTPFSPPPRHDYAALVPSVGCPLGCNFCATSAMFGGKGHSVNFHETGDELFEIMSKIEEALGMQGFTVLDENFLLQTQRTRRLLELIEKHNKPWSMNIFASANILKAYSMDELVRLGISRVWLGIEGKDSQYKKLSGTDTRELVKELRANGIGVLGSTIIGLDEHSEDNIDEVIDYAVSHETEFQQFMLYMPLPGTPLHAELEDRGLLLGENELPLADIHGQYRFAHRHPHIESGKETEFLLRAFSRDFHAKGPGILRGIQTKLNGWRRHKNHPKEHVRRRFTREVERLGRVPAAMLWAGRRWFRGNSRVYKELTATLEEVYREFGLRARMYALLVGPVLYWRTKKEERRLAGGWTYEPGTFYEKNYIPSEDEVSRCGPADQIRWVEASNSDGVEAGVDSDICACVG